MYPLLEICGASKTYKSDGAAFTLKVNTLHIHAGQKLGIIGASGCGKSTLLEMLALIAKPDSSQCFKLNFAAETKPIDVANLWQHRQLTALADLRANYMGFVHQTGNLYPFLSLYDNVALSLRMLGRSSLFIRTEVERVTKFLGIQHLLRQMPAKLSYGERQRGAIARAVIHNPKIVFADEPTSALDPDTAFTVMTLLADASKRFGCALVLVSHDHRLLTQSGFPLVVLRQQSETVDNLQVGTRHRVWCVEAMSFECPERLKLDNAEYTVRDQRSEQMKGLSTEEQGKPIFSSECVNNIGGDGINSVCHFCRGPRQANLKIKSFKRIWLTVVLSWRDMLFEWPLSLCGILAFASALIPLLLLSGLRFGAIETITQRLLNNPAALAVIPYSNIRYTPELLESIQNLAGVDFITPCPRKLAATVFIQTDDGFIAADIIPSAAGDPLLKRYAVPVTANGIVLSKQLARHLSDLAVGDLVNIKITKSYQGKISHVFCQKTLLAILPDSADWNAHIYATLDFAEEVESYKDGYAVKKYNWDGEEPMPQPGKTYAGFRMYVKTLDDVVGISDDLKGLNINAYTFAREVETLQHLRSGLLIITVFTGGVTITGMLLSLASLAISNVRRKERVFAQLRLMGMGSLEMFVYPVIQTIIVALCAASAAFFIYHLSVPYFEKLAANWLRGEEAVSSLPLTFVGYVYLVAILGACICNIGVVFHLLKLQPAEVLRQDA